MKNDSSITQLTITDKILSNQIVLSKGNNDFYPDYVCFNITSVNGNLTHLKNPTNLTKYLGSATSNVAVQFVFESTVYANLTLSYAYQSFGSFQPYLYTKYGGNFYDTQNNEMIMIRNIEEYPFQIKIYQN